MGLTRGRFHDASKYLAEHPFEHAVTFESRTGTREGRVRALCEAIGANPFDLVVVVEVPDALEAMARLRRRFTKAPRLVMAIHNIVPGFFEDMRRFRHVLDGVVGTSRLACALAREVGSIEASRVWYAPYGVKLPGEERREFPLRRQRVLYAGRLERAQKRVQDLPAILDEADRRGIPVELAIAGNGSEENGLRARLSDRIARGQVRFLGALPGDRMITEAYGPADVLLVTSQWETGPIVLWEGAASGLAIVTSAYTGCRAEGSLRDGENCLMYPVGDVGSAAACLERTADPELRCRLAREGRALVAVRYSRDVSVNLWDEALTAVVGRDKVQRGGFTPWNEPVGRLDRLLGPGLGETVRELLRRRYPHQWAGEEWPYYYGSQPTHEAKFWEFAEGLERLALE